MDLSTHGQQVQIIGNNIIMDPNTRPSPEEISRSVQLIFNLTHDETRVLRRRLQNAYRANGVEISMTTVTTNIFARPDVVEHSKFLQNVTQDTIRKFLDRSDVRVSVGGPGTIVSREKEIIMGANYVPSPQEIAAHVKDAFRLDDDQANDLAGHLKDAYEAHGIEISDEAMVSVEEMMGDWERIKAKSLQAIARNQITTGLGLEVVAERDALVEKIEGNLGIVNGKMPTNGIPIYGSLLLSALKVAVSKLGILSSDWVRNKLRSINAAMGVQKSRRGFGRVFLKGIGGLAGAAALKQVGSDIFLPLEGKPGRMMTLSGESPLNPRKKTKILIHGAYENDIPNSFRGMAQEAAKRDENFVVYAYDQNSSMEDWVNDLIKGIKSLGVNPKDIEYIPYSLGAVIFWNAVLKDPELFRNVQVTQFAPALGGAIEAAQYPFVTLQKELAKFGYPVLSSNDDIRLTIALHPDGEVKKFKMPQMYNFLLDIVGRNNVRTFQPGVDKVIIPYYGPLLGKVRTFQGAVHEHIAEHPDVINATFDRAMLDYGGIDLNTTLGMHWKDSKDGRGVEMDLDPALIARIRHDGVDWLEPKVLKMTPINSIWLLVGCKAPV